MYKQIFKYSLVLVLSFGLVLASNAKSLNTKQSSPQEEIKMIIPNSAFPVFIVKNLSKAKTFYESNFDFKVAFKNEWYLHLVSNSGIQVAFMLPDQKTQPDFFRQSYTGKGVIFSLEVNDADSVYSFAKKQSLNIVLDLRSEEWGQRHFSLKDPNGVYIDIVQAIKPSEEYQKGYEDK